MQNSSWIVCSTPTRTPALIRADQVVGVSEGMAKGVGAITVVSVSGGQFVVRDTLYQVVQALHRALTAESSPLAPILAEQFPEAPEKEPEA